MLEHIFLGISIAATSILFFQLTTLFSHHSNEEEANLQLFTFRNVTALFTGIGWCGFVLSPFQDIPKIVNIGISIFCGWTTMMASAVFYHLIFVFKNKSTFDLLEEVRGKEATVCKIVPDVKNLGRTGKIDLLLQGKAVELNAWNKNKGNIKIGTRVMIKDVANGMALVEVMDQTTMSLADTQYTKPVEQS